VSMGYHVLDEMVHQLTHDLIAQRHFSGSHDWVVCAWKWC
jgi:hypothetical protein